MNILKGIKKALSGSASLVYEENFPQSGKEKRKERRAKERKLTQVNKKRNTR